MADFIVYGSPLSPFVRKVESALRIAGAEYDFENINIMDMPDWFKEISPARRIPVLRDKTIGTTGIPGTIADSSAICLFLEKRFDTGLYGKDAFEAGRVAWFEEYADSAVAMTLGMHLFRPLIFPLFAGKPSDVDTARATMKEKLPEFFDYLESSLDGNAYLVGDSLSVADLSVAAQMSQLYLVAGLPDKTRWPSLVKHTETMMAHPSFSENLTTCAAILKSIMPEKADLS
ncbi:MAG: glutathione S-transferase family protein [Pseudomonadota bacterium]